MAHFGAKVGMERLSSTNLYCRCARTRSLCCARNTEGSWYGSQTYGMDCVRIDVLMLWWYSPWFVVPSTATRHVSRTISLRNTPSNRQRHVHSLDPALPSTLHSNGCYHILSFDICHPSILLQFINKNALLEIAGWRSRRYLRHLELLVLCRDNTTAICHRKIRSR